MLLISLGKLGQLTWTERGLVFRAVLLLPVIHGWLTVLGYTSLRRGLEKSVPLKASRISCSEAAKIQRAREIARAVSIAAKHGVYKASCLRRSMLTWLFLRREGIESQICFGVRLNDHQLEAHAWVEHQGIVVNDSADIRSIFRALEEVLPPTARGL